MLYISRHVYCKNLSARYRQFQSYQGHHAFGVVDSDDGVEELVTRDDLEEIVRNQCIDVAGVEIMSPSRLILQILPYQGENPSSVLQTKLSVLRHVNITVYNSTITSFLFRRDKLADGTRVRLSDFADSCGDFLMYGNMSLAAGPIVTIVLDDKIKSITDYSFRLDSGNEVSSLGVSAVSSLDVMFDLSELTNFELARSVYKQVLAYKGEPLKAVIDSEERKQEMFRLCCS